MSMVRPARIILLVFLIIKGRPLATRSPDRPRPADRKSGGEARTWLRGGSMLEQQRSQQPLGEGHYAHLHQGFLAAALLAFEAGWFFVVWAVL